MDQPVQYFPLTPDSKDDDYYDGGDDYTMHVVPLNPPSGDPSANWQWCLLTLAGNATILQLRKEDFVRYLKMNLASLIGTEERRELKLPYIDVEGGQNGFYTGN